MMLPLLWIGLAFIAGGIVGVVALFIFMAHTVPPLKF